MPIAMWAHDATKQKLRKTALGIGNSMKQVSRATKQKMRATVAQRYTVNVGDARVGVSSRHRRRSLQREKSNDYFD